MVKNEFKQELKDLTKEMVKSKHIYIILLQYVLKGIRRYQRGRQKSLSRKTDKTMVNKMKRKTNIEQTTLH